MVLTDSKAMKLRFANVREFWWREHNSTETATAAL